MTAWLEQALAALAASPVLQGLVAALATFVLEDAATVACGLLVAADRMSGTTAFVALTLGIAGGDLGLHLAGRALGPRLVARGWVSAARLEAASASFRRHAVLALVASRFVPGLRLPTYLASGILRARLGVFLPVVTIASAAWVALLLHATVRADRALLAPLGAGRWPVAVAAVALVAAIPLGLARLRSAREKSGPPVASRFEFWPPWLYYLPVAAWQALLALRYRDPLLPSAANPSIHAGGLIGESKSEVLDLITGDSRRFVAAHVRIVRQRGARREELRDAALAALRARGIELPVVAKPDLGMRGAGVVPCRTEDELAGYLAAFPAGESVVIQELVGEGPRPPDEDLPPRLRGVREAGILWWRDPATGSSEIFSLTLKRFPSLTGDGRASVRELIARCPRARLLRKRYETRHARELDRVLAAGESFPLVFAGNHCQGAIFLDGTDLATPELLRRCDAIAASMGDFWFGRFDVRCEDPRAMLRGEGFRIVEINGAGAEATHVWDPSARVVDAWATACRQWTILYRIGAANRARGARSVGVARFLRDARAQRRIAAACPVTR